MTRTPIPVVVQGLGPMGRVILAAAQADPALDVIGVVDIDPEMAGRTLGELGLEPGGLTVSVSLPPSPTGRPSGSPADAQAVLLHATGSYLDSVAPQLLEALEQGWHVVTTCEELAYPYHRHPDLSETLDAAAHAAGRTIVGTGVNPGLLMDRLPIFLAAASHGIRSIRVERVQDPTPRRIPFQRKVGVGLSRAEFDAKAATGAFGHVGLEESGRLIAAGLGWRIDNWARELRAVQADPAQTGPDTPVLGLLETLSGSTDDGHTIDLHFEAQTGVAESYDAVTVDGTPPLHLRFHGGVLGDPATAAAALRGAHVVAAARRGLVTVLDLPLRPWPHLP